MNPTVSVCIPTYNGATYLADCLDSVLSQTYREFEVLIVDDRSSDASAEIASAYARRDSRIRVFVNETNLGLVGNWNRCVQLSRSEWVKFVFQDDLILSECLSRMLAVAIESDRPIVSCAREFLFAAGTSDEDREYYSRNKAQIQNIYRDSQVRSAQQCSEAALQWIGRNLVGEPTAVLLHRSVFEHFGLFNPHLCSACDFEYWVRVTSNTGLAHIPETLAMFRVHPGSMSAHYTRIPRLSYRVDVIDPLLVVHDYAFHPLYAGLRAVATNCRPRIDLVDEFWRRALSALWWARRAADDRPHCDTSLLEEWHRVAQDYPRLASMPIGARIVSKWRAFRKTISFGSKWRNTPAR